MIKEIEDYKKKSILRIHKKYNTSITFINPTIQTVEDKLHIKKEWIMPISLLILPVPIIIGGEQNFPENKIMILEEDDILKKSIKNLQNENSNLKKLIKQLEEQKNATIG